MLNPDLPQKAFSLDRVQARKILFRIVGADNPLKARALPPDGVITGARRCEVVFSCEEGLLAGKNRITIALTNQTPTPVLVNVRLDHGAAVSFTGGRALLRPNLTERLLFPASDFGFYGADHSWDHVATLTLSICREKDHEGPDAIRVRVESVAVERVQFPEGPRLTEEGLRRVAPGHQELFSPVFAGRPIEAESPQLLIPAPTQYPLGLADDVLAGRIMGHDFGEEINWSADPVAAHEWLHFLHRHHFLRPLLTEFLRSGNRRYLDALERAIVSWIRANPAPVGSNGGAGPAWETLSAAWRLYEWLLVAQAVWGRLAPEAQSLMAQSVWEHCRHLMDHEGHPNNWRIVETATLARCALRFPGFAESAAWFEEGWGRLQCAIDRQFFPDGAHFELSPLYHALCLQMTLMAREDGRLVGQSLPLPLEQRLERAVRYLDTLARPDGSWPSVNDSGGYRGDYSALMRYARAQMGAAAPTEPQSLSMFADAGVGVMRAGGHYLMFRAGPGGAAHVHEDVLSLDVYAAGACRLIDPGITSYAPGGLTEHYRCAGAHNSFLVNAAGPVRSKAPYRERITTSPQLKGKVDCRGITLEGEFLGPWECGADVRIRRTIRFTQEDLWIVEDYLVAAEPHELAVCWQFAPGAARWIAEKACICSRSETGSDFELSLTAGLPSLRVAALQGWASLDGRDVAAPAFHMLFQGSKEYLLRWVLSHTRKRS